MSQNACARAFRDWLNAVRDGCATRRYYFDESCTKYDLSVGADMHFSGSSGENEDIHALEWELVSWKACPSGFFATRVLFGADEMGVILTLPSLLACWPGPRGEIGYLEREQPRLSWWKRLMEK
jgi:hypothetical protein